jgi:excisionase family DNA binding protein
MSDDLIGDLLQERLLTAGEVAALLRVDPKTVTRWAASGRITSIRTPGGHRRFRESEVRAIVQGDAPPKSDGAKPGGLEAPPEDGISLAVVAQAMGLSRDAALAWAQDQKLPYYCGSQDDVVLSRDEALQALSGTFLSAADVIRQDDSIARIQPPTAA